MALPKIVLKNQFGEESNNYILQSTLADLGSIANNTVVANTSGASAPASAITTQALSNRLPAKAGVQSIAAESAASAVTIALSTGNTYSDAAVNTAVNGALVTVIADLNAAITQMNSILAQLKVVS